MRAIYKSRKPSVEGEAEPPRKRARPAGLPFFGPTSVSSFAFRLLASSRVYVLHDCTPLDVVILRYLREKNRIGNPSLNLHLLCLIPKYLDLIFMGLVLWALLGGWMCMNGLRISMGFGPSFGLWPSSFSVLALDHGPRHFMLQNRPKTCKNEVPPKYMCKCENDQ